MNEKGPKPESPYSNVSSDPEDYENFLGMKKSKWLSFIVDHTLNTSYEDTIVSLEEGGYHMSETTPNERLSLLTEETQERGDLLKAYETDIDETLADTNKPLEAEERSELSRSKIAIINEVTNLDIIYDVAHELWDARGGFSELTQSIANNPKSQEILQKTGIKEETDDVLLHLKNNPPVQKDLVVLKKDLDKKLSEIESSEKSTQSVYVQEAIQQVRAYLEELGRPSGSS